LATKQLKKQECITTLKNNCHLAKFRPKTKMLEVKGSQPQFFWGDVAKLAIVHKRI
jgi:hypothetical protein